MATKEKTAFVCQSCGYDSPKWSGKCPACGQWNSFKEYKVGTNLTISNNIGSKITRPTPKLLSSIEGAEQIRYNLNDDELNRVLGGGLVKGSLTLIGGEPGIGKSTLILQTLLNVSDRGIIYISGEESEGQIKLRAERLYKGDIKSISHLTILCDTSLENIYSQIDRERVDIVVIDSIQTISTDTIDSSAGSITQVRECAASLLKFAKESNIPIILIGHITKDGSIAGPKILEHIVDTVIQFEGDQHYMYRILRPIKNRFGNCAELGIYEMQQEGLRQVNNPSELLLSGNNAGMSGLCVASTVEGARTFLIEAQALVSSAVYGTPQRSAIGFDVRRLNMLLAVLEKRVGFKLAQKDVFLNIAGGLRVNDPAIDLAVMCAILSSNLDIAIERCLCVTGEVGLSGEIRPVSRIEQRISEAQKLGFKTIIIPHNNAVSLKREEYSIQIIAARRVDEAFKQIFG